MEIKKIKELIELLESTDITEFELSEGKDSVKISKLQTHTQVVSNIPTHIAAPFVLPKDAAGVSLPSVGSAVG